MTAYAPTCVDRCTYAVHTCIYMYIQVCKHPFYAFMCVLILFDLFTLKDSSKVGVSENRKRKRTVDDEQLPDKENNSKDTSLENESLSSATKSASGVKRRKSEDALELHPTIDWEEEDGNGGTKKLAQPKPGLKTKSVDTSHSQKSMAV